MSAHMWNLTPIDSECKVPIADIALEYFIDRKVHSIFFTNYVCFTYHT